MRALAIRLVALLLLTLPGAGCGVGSMPASTTSTPAASPATAASGLEPTPAPSGPDGPTERARIVRVVDGDTVIIDRGLGSERLRYIGIDAPESVTPDTPVEFMGREAAAANAALVDGHDVVLERDVSDRDRFDRLLRYVWLPVDGGWLLVNLELVRQGYATAVSFPPDVRYQNELRAAERTARAAGLGLWGPATPPP